ncbi:MAG: BTAD domain-containing putative transcriptional regulator [Longicatena sp.]
MKKKANLNIRLLGEFMIENEYNKFPKDRKKSTQVIILLAYLIVFRGTMITKNRLIEVLWPNDESDNPEGALRNLIYRARKELACFFPNDSKKLCIISKGNAYAWNSELDCNIDIDKLKDISKAIVEEKDTEQIYKYTMNLLTNYSDEFLYEFCNEEWVALEKEKYEKAKYKAISYACQKFINDKRFEDVIETCTCIDFKQYADPIFYEFKLYAYYKLDQVAAGMSYYHQVSDLYYSKLGIQVSEGIQKVYKNILDSSTHKAIDVASLEKNLQENRVDAGTFYCDFDVFKNIYQINVRTARRSTRSKFLVLLTLVDESNTLSEAKMTEESEKLRTILYADLRKNDVFSKCNTKQYSLIVATTKVEGCQKAIQRILNKFDAKKKEQSIKIVYDIKNII